MEVKTSTVREFSAPTLPASAPAVAAANEEVWHEPVERKGVDGSHIYKAASKLYGDLSDEDKKMIAHPADEVDADKAAALFEKLKPLMELLHKGAEADYCDWALGSLSYEKPMPQFPMASDLGKAALWFAAYRFPMEPAAAVNDLAARAQLGRDVDDLLVGVLVNASFENSAIELLRQNVEHFTPEAFANARALLADSLSAQDTTRALAAETGEFERQGEKLVAGAPNERGDFLRTAKIASPPNSPDRSSQWEALNNLDAFKAEFQSSAEIQRRLLAALALSDEQFQPVRQQVESMLADHPLAALVVPVYDSVRMKLQQANVQREMLKAGLDLVQSGPSLAGQTRDRSTGQPFLYTPNENGFTLQSTFQVKGKPVTMSFPKTK